MRPDTRPAVENALCHAGDAAGPDGDAPGCAQGADTVHELAGLPQHPVMLLVVVKYDLQCLVSALDLCGLFEDAPPHSGDALQLAAAALHSPDFAGNDLQQIQHDEKSTEPAVGALGAAGDALTAALQGHAMPLLRNGPSAKPQH